VKYDKENNEWRGEINVKGQKVDILIYGEFKDENINDVVKRNVLKIEANWEKFNNSIIENLLSLYNDVWRQEDKPVLSEDEFLKNIIIESVNIDEQDDEDDTMCIYYKDSGLFAGHYIELFLDSDGTIYNAEIIG
jgi:hypothetical protein